MSFGLMKLSILGSLGASSPAFAGLLDEPIKPVRASLNQDPARIEIGRQFFGDVRLSANNRWRANRSRKRKHVPHCPDRQAWQL